MGIYKSTINGDSHHISKINYDSQIQIKGVRYTRVPLRLEKYLKHLYSSHVFIK